MSTTTYDPILETRELSRFRVFAPLASPGLGTALVLQPAEGDPLVIEAGQRVPEARLGDYRRSFLVDLGQYGLRMDERLPTRDPSFQFQCSVTFNCRVLDPAAVARMNIRDMTSAVRLTLVRIMRRVGRDYDISGFNDAEAALNDALERFRGDRAIQLSSFLVELAPGGEYHDTMRGIRMDDIRRGAMEDVVAGGQQSIWAQWLAKHDGDPSELIELEARSKALEQEHLLDAMRIVSSSGEKTEPFDTNAERRRLLGRLVSDPEIGSLDRGRGSRRSRLAGSLSLGGPTADAADLGDRGDSRGTPPREPDVGPGAAGDGGASGRRDEGGSRTYRPGREDGRGPRERRPDGSDGSAADDARGPRDAATPPVSRVRGTRARSNGAPSHPGGSDDPDR